MRPALLVLVLGSAQLSPAQNKTPEQKPTAQLMLVLPTQLGNAIFDRLTSPLGEVDASFQLPLWKGIKNGAGVRGMWWELQQHAFSQLNTNGDARRLAYYGKVQYAHYTGERTFYELNAKAGSSTWTWDCSTCENNVSQQGAHWGAGAGYYVHASDNLAFGVTIGYESDATIFSPEVICLDEFPGYTDRGGPYRFFIVGLGFSTRFQKSEEERW